MKYVKKIVIPILMLILTKINTNFGVFLDHYNQYKYPFTVMIIHLIQMFLGIATVLYIIKIMIL